MESSERADWRDAMDADDREAFREAARPYMDRLITAARHDLDYYIEQGELRADDFTPEEIAGEALIYAWDHRDKRPDQVSLQGWLLGTQHRLLRGMVRETLRYRDDKTLSLDEKIPPEAQAEGDLVWYQYSFQDAALTWEDVTPASEPVDVTAPLFTNEDTFHLDPEERHAVMMHDEFEMDLTEVAFTMERSVQETAALLERARTSLHKRQGAAPTADNALSGTGEAPPAAPEDDDATDQNATAQ